MPCDGFSRLKNCERVDRDHNIVAFPLYTFSFVYITNRFSGIVRWRSFKLRDYWWKVRGAAPPCNLNIDLEDLHGVGKPNWF